MSMPIFAQDLSPPKKIPHGNEEWKQNSRPLSNFKLLQNDEAVLTKKNRL